MTREADPPGDPDLEVAGFRLWIRRREFPDAESYWDGNWLRVDARCEAHGARVRVEGPFLMVPDIERFMRECEALSEHLAGAATLDSHEPNVRLGLTGEGRTGRLSLRVEITPDLSAQEHRFTFELDQTHLAGIIARCRAILRGYPVRGTPQ